MSAVSKLADWQRFVIDHGWRASQHELAAVLGRDPEDVERFRRLRVCSRLDAPKQFPELFQLWHGREPVDSDWPAPRKVGARGHYEWQAPELALLASLVGVISQAEIAEVLTERLRKVAGDPEASRNKAAVQIRTNQMGLQTTDVVGGITTAEAARDIGSFAIVNQMIDKGEIPTRRVGRLHVIPYDEWEKWKAKRVFPPAGYVQLSTLRESLAIKSDKLSEYARMGLIPTAIRCNPYGTKGPSTQFGTWWVSPETAAKLLADRRSGRRMPWHGRYTDNLRTTYKLWEKRKHPASCKTCTEIWGDQGVPRTFEDYSARYPSLAHGAKRHLTRPWAPGLTLKAVAARAGKTLKEVRCAIENGVFAATTEGGIQYVSATDAAQWIARKCPNGESARSWMTLEAASAAYLFTMRELRGFIASGKLKHKLGVAGNAAGVQYVLRHQCGQLREKIGFTEAEAARRLGVTVARFRHLVEGVDWRRAERVPLVTVHAVRKRLESRHGYTIEEAALVLGCTEALLKQLIDQGATRVSRAKWDRRRVYISEPMMARLRQAMEKPQVDDKLGEGWLLLSEAAVEAGVSGATINNWAISGDLAYRERKGVRHFSRVAVRAKARRYWENPRLHRAIPPTWLGEPQ